MITRAPANPMRAPGSARMISPSIAKLAVTPPVVGSVRTEMYRPPDWENRLSLALVFAICIRLKAASCMRAPPEAETMINGRLCSRA